MAAIDFSAIDRDALKTQAVELRREKGYNCAQAVICALAPHLDMDVDTAFRMAEAFGAGMGGMTETCGAISGAMMALGMVKSTGCDEPTSKGGTYKLAREVCHRFNEENGSTICRELKGAGTEHGPLRSCPGCIEDAIDFTLDALVG